MTEQDLRNAVRRFPTGARAHLELADCFLATGRAPSAEIHYANAAKLGGERIAAHLGLARACLAQSKLSDAHAFINTVLASEPNNRAALETLANIRAAMRDIAGARQALADAKRAAPQADYSIADAKLQARLHGPGALGAFPDALPAPALLERGKLKDKAGDYEGAWSDWSAANAALRRQGFVYKAAEAGDLFARLKRAFPCPAAPAPVASGAQPIFITGYPRSGTTLLEQMLTAHPDIVAGDELPFVHILAREAPRLIPSPLPYPECLSDGVFADRADLATTLRDAYLRKADQRGLRTAAYFTDKMPLNETHLGLIRLMFPKALVLHVKRHPLDVVVSNFNTFLTHGFSQSFDIASIARHYRAVSDLVRQYTDGSRSRVFIIQYEDLTRDPIDKLRRILEAADLPWDDACLRPQDNARYARTASHASVAEPVHDKSIGRWKHYEQHLGAAKEILGDALLHFNEAA